MRCEKRIYIYIYIYMFVLYYQQKQKSCTKYNVQLFGVNNHEIDEFQMEMIIFYFRTTIKRI
jgi:hypothetical protein